MLIIALFPLNQMVCTGLSVSSYPFLNKKHSIVVSITVYLVLNIYGMFEVVRIIMLADFQPFLVLIKLEIL